jgi:thiol-disulfide isomerase/thioredoxin
VDAPKADSAATQAQLLAIPARERTFAQDYRLACLYAQQGRADDAFASLADAAVKGFGDLAALRAEPALASLHSDSRWQQVEVFVDVNGSRGPLPDRTADPPKPIPVQSQMPPPSRVNIPAPDWTLPDANGQLVKLSDLRGKIVVMDFWATWCGPCQRSMPEIDKFVREHGSEDLVVFSVNVWDRSHEVALEWWKQQNYSMKLLFGDRNLTTAYEVQGIPHLCVIDGKGIIRYSQAGFDPRLVDYLVKWTDEARKQG